MSGKSGWLCSLAVVLLGLGVARSQAPDSPAPARIRLSDGSGTFASTPPDPSSTPVLTAAQENTNSGNNNNPDAGPMPGTDKPGNGGPPITQEGWSSWLIYPRTPGCCGPTGGGPIGWEVYARSGLNFTIGGGLFNTELDPGWAIQGGGRVLFFNPTVDSAWTIDASVSNVYYNDGKRQQQTLINAPVLSTGPTGNTVVTPTPTEVTVRDLNETFVNASFGREWYLMGTADCKNAGPIWRVGADAGGSWGSAKVDLQEFTHLTKEVGGLNASIHSDLECPCGPYIILLGTRFEYSCIWTSILQTQMDVQSLNVLCTLGVRY